MPEAHLGFIAAAYAVTGVVLLATVAAIALDYRVQQRAVARLSGRLAEPAPRPEEAP